MARTSSSGKSGGTSRIRFIMLDAELPDGDLTHITQAIQNALKGGSPSTPRANQLLSAPPSPARTPNSGAEAAEEEMEPEADDIDVADQEASPSASRTSKPRKYVTPKVIELDLTTEPSLASYVADKNATSDQRRFLVIAAWLKEHRSIKDITQHHIYTCYRALHWPTDIGDFAGPLRSLKQRQLLEQTGRGTYSINHLGIAEVEKPASA